MHNNKYFLELLFERKDTYSFEKKAIVSVTPYAEVKCGTMHIMQLDGRNNIDTMVWDGLHFMASRASEKPIGFIIHRHDNIVFIYRQKDIKIQFTKGYFTYDNSWSKMIEIVK